MLYPYLAAFACSLSYTLSKGWPWNIPAGSSLDEWIWRVPEAAAILVVLPIVISAAAAQLAKWKPDSFGQSRRKAEWLYFGDWLFLVAAIAFWFIRPSIAYLTLLIVAWASLQLAALLRAQAKIEGVPVRQSMNFVGVLFFVSGFSAIIYQIVWQRTLFAMFGSDVESVTIIVSVFMFGLGVGALMGNFLLTMRGQLLQIFLVIELLIGLFGFFSLPIAQHIQSSLNIDNRLALVIAAYALFAFPTLLMGATLPILVAYLNQTYQNIGRSSGFLYAANTWGSSLAAFLAVIVIFSLTGQQVATWIAAAFNILTAGAIYLIAPNLKNIGSSTSPSTGPAIDRPISLRWAVLLSFSIGFITLSQELVWYRLLGLASGSDPRIFGLLLGCVLLGIGSGSYRVKRACETGKSVRSLLTTALFFAAILSFLTVPIVSLAAGLSSRAFGVLVGFAFVGTIAFCTGGMLPALAALCETSGADKNVRRLGWVYASNILGATLGPLATGYILFEAWTFEASSAALAVALLVLMGAIAERKARHFVYVATAAILFSTSYAWLNNGILERIQLEKLDAPKFASRIDTRASVVTATEATGGLIVYGGGAYDGRINIDPVANTNGIDRAYIVPALHPNPKRILEIGLSSGAWAKVLLSFEGLEKLVSVEINDGYLQLIAKVPMVASILQDPKITLSIDDGRRWLRRNPQERFDVIVMNTTLHWRSQITNLLSVEFFRLCKSRLAEGGVFYFNTTGSQDAIFTAAQVFPYVVQYASFAAASSRPFDLSSIARRNNLLRFRTDSGASFFQSRPQLEVLLKQMSEAPLHDVGNLYRQRTDLRVITDDNMLTEFKL